MFKNITSSYAGPFEPGLAVRIHISCGNPFPMLMSQCLPSNRHFGSIGSQIMLKCEPDLSAFVSRIKTTFPPQGFG